MADLWMSCGADAGASRKAMRDYKAMISHALKKLPNNKVRRYVARCLPVVQAS